MTVKYVIFELDGLIQAVLIPDNSGLNHADVYIRNYLGSEGTVVSAGFCKFYDEGAKCWGESISLNKQSRPKEDAQIINFKFRGY